MAFQKKKGSVSDRKRELREKGKQFGIWSETEQRYVLDK